MGFYKETWTKMEEFNRRIDEKLSQKSTLGNAKAGTILIETNTWKK